VKSLLKQDLFGSVFREDRAAGPVVVRDLTGARWWLRPLARHLAGREARALKQLETVADGVPRLLSWNGTCLERTWLEGRPMQAARPSDPAFFAQSLRLLRQIHAAGVVHNDLAKEPNWLVGPAGEPRIVDFQLAWAPARRARLFRLLRREDLRHALKHRRYYAADSLTRRQRQILSTPAWTSRAWRATVKPVYLWVTRRLLGWADREGAGDRQLRRDGAARRLRRDSRAGILSPPCSSDWQESMDICHPHNRLSGRPAGPANFGIRLSLPPGDPMRGLLGDDWAEFQWFDSEEAREAKLRQLKEQFVYYRRGDRPTFVLERVQRT
jgi:predicted Ser/Thr protein kinase